MLSREQCRAADQIAITRYGIPGIVLMENAGHNCARELIAFDMLTSDRRRIERPEGVVPDSKTGVILCGPGNNGGDGFVIARHLSLAGWNVKVFLFGRGEDVSGDALTNLNSISRFSIPVIELEAAWTPQKIESSFLSVRRTPTRWVIDALLGTGATGDPRAAMANAINVVNGLDVGRMAIDIPSGLDCETGIPSATTFRADLTCTMVDQKIGFANSRASEYLGTVKIVGIGAPV